MIDLGMWIFLGLCLHALLSNLLKTSGSSSLGGLYIRQGLEDVARAINHLATILGRKE